jgi:hypothetical protein
MEVQSGGEKTVATCFFLLALHAFMSFPFQVIDEINQGMDPKRERVVMDAIVDSVLEKKPQSFIVTPKLLEDMAYREDVVILLVVKGPYNLSQKQYGQFHNPVMEASQKYPWSTSQRQTPHTAKGIKRAGDDNGSGSRKRGTAISLDGDEEEDMQSL